MIELEVIGTEPVELDVIMSSGVQIENQNKTVTPSEAEQLVTADPGYTGLGTVTVEGIDPEYVGSDIPRRSSADLTASGAAVSVPAGYYENSAGKSISSGSVGTPTATKGAVAGHAIAVTPSVTSSAGYIAGGTKTGTAVSVSAAELVSGTKSISANGTEDVTNYASISVSVPNSYTTADEGKVVDNGALVAQTSDTVTQNDTYDTTLINSLTVNVSGGSGVDMNDIAEGTAPSGIIILDSATKIVASAFAGMPLVTGIHAKKPLTAFANTALSSSFCKTFVCEGRVAWNTYSALQDRQALEAIDLLSYSQLSNAAMRNTIALATIVLRGDTVSPLGGTPGSVFNKSSGVSTYPPFNSNGTGGTLYVPQALVTAYQAAANWSTLLGYTNNQIKSIESTHTDPDAPIDLTLYYADGTPIS